MAPRSPRVGSPRRAIWLLTAAVAGTAALLSAVVVRGLPSPMGTHLPWWILAGAFLLTEVHVVHIRVRGEAHTLSLSELPLVLGLFFASPLALLAAHIAGAAVALVGHRRQSAVKVAFNLSQFALSTAIAITLFGLLAPRPDNIVALGTWSATFVATLAASLTSIGLIFAVSSLAERRLDPGRLRQSLPAGLIVTAANTSLGIMGVVLVSLSPQAVWLMLVPAATLFFGYRAYVSERQRREKLDILHGCAKRLEAHSPERSIVETVLAEAQRMFRAGEARVAMIPFRDGRTVAVATIDHTGVVTERRNVIDDPDCEWVLEATSGGGTGFLSRAGEPRTAIVSPLPGEDGATGALLVTNRLGDGDPFTAEDLQLLETLAGRAAAAIVNGRLERTLAKLSQLEEEHKHLAFHDALTELPNRTMFVDYVGRALLRTVRHRRPLAVLFVDVDDFKMVNDSFGHAAGDRLLIEVASRLRTCLRIHDLACRFGGDEFALLVEQLGEPADAIRVVERLQEALRDPFLVGDDIEVFVHVSIGIAVSVDGSEGAEEFMRNADVAMYAAKARGKNGYRFYEPAMHESVRERLQLRSEIERALDRREFVLHHQPIVDLGTGCIVGTEALVRWQRPGKGLVGPAEFVQLAEDTGQILRLGSWVLEEAAALAGTWHRTFGPLWMSVNVSPRQLSSETFIDEVRRTLAATGLDPSTLILEITESALISDVDLAQQRMAALKELGVRLAVDDFGTGYSSLGFLARFPIDILKIDRTFVAGMGSNPQHDAVAEAIVRLGQTLGLDTMAEGIETEDQLERLRALGCTYGQGYHLGRPVPVADAERTLGASLTQTAAATGNPRTA